MGIFSGLEKLGLKNLDNTEVIEKKKSDSAGKAVTETIEKKEKDFIFDRRYECPACGLTFSSKSVKATGVKTVGKDSDLRPVYDLFDPLKYDAVTCDKCGYSAISRFLKNCTSRQAKLVKDNISMGFSGIDNEKETFDYDDAIIRHKLALACAVVKKAKNSERAYTSLKLAWVLRGKRLTLNAKDESKHNEIKELYKDEMECLANAYEGFEIAMSSENYPIAGMDELTLKYIMSDIARKQKRFEVALKFTGDIVTSRAASNRIKDEALKQKELIKQDMKAASAAVHNS